MLCIYRLAQPSIIHFQAIDIHAIFAVFFQNEFVKYNYSSFNKEIIYQIFTLIIQAEVFSYFFSCSFKSAKKVKNFIHVLDTICQMNNPPPFFHFEKSEFMRVFRIKGHCNNVRRSIIYFLKHKEHKLMKRKDCCSYRLAVNTL